MRRLAMSCALGSAWLLAGMLDPSWAQAPAGTVPAARVPEASQPLELWLPVPVPRAEAAPAVVAAGQPRVIYGTITLPGPRPTLSITMVEPFEVAPGLVIPASSFTLDRAAPLNSSEFVIPLTDAPVPPALEKSLPVA